MFYLIGCDDAIKVNQYLIFILIACEQLERGDYKDSDCDLRRTSLGEMIKKMMTEMVTKMVTIISMMMMITTWEEPAWAGLLRILSTAAIVAVSTRSGQVKFLHLHFTINQILEQTIRQIDAHIMIFLLLIRAQYRIDNRACLNQCHLICYPINIRLWRGTTFTVLAMVLYDVEAYWPARTSRWEIPWRRANGLEARWQIVRAPHARGTFVIEAIREHQVLVTPCM